MSYLWTPPAGCAPSQVAQGRVLGSDEFTVPLCRTPHRELHRRGDERVWWRQVSIDLLLTASALWAQSHLAVAQPHVKTTSKEDAEDYKAFEAAVIADYDAQSAVERELVLRLASLLWRIRRATTMQAGLFEIQARQLLEFRRKRDAQLDSDVTVHRLFDSLETTGQAEAQPCLLSNSADQSTDLAICFLRLANMPSYPLDRLSRYEAALWRQAGQTMFALNALHRRKPLGGAEPISTGRQRHGPLTSRRTDPCGWTPPDLDPAGFIFVKGDRRR